MRASLTIGSPARAPSLLSALLALAAELRLETSDFLLELAEQRVLGILVDLRLVLDVLRAVCIAVTPMYR